MNNRVTITWFRGRWLVETLFDGKVIFMVAAFVNRGHAERLCNLFNDLNAPWAKIDVLRYAPVALRARITRALHQVMVEFGLSFEDVYASFGEPDLEFAKARFEQFLKEDPRASE